MLGHVSFDLYINHIKLLVIKRNAPEWNLLWSIAN